MEEFVDLGELADDLHEFRMQEHHLLEESEGDRHQVLIVLKDTASWNQFSLLCLDSHDEVLYDL